MRILISNDDGVYSPGILALAKAVKQFGEVRIVAPDVEQSSMGHAITASRPLRLKSIQLDSLHAYRVNGTPADCVALGMHRWGHVDVVLSGINLGLNLGNSCWHSGTLAAAKQAALLGSRGIAFSTNVSDSREPDFATLESYVVGVQVAVADQNAFAGQRESAGEPEGHPLDAAVCAALRRQFFPTKTRPVGRFFGSQSPRLKALRKGRIAGQSSTVGYRLLRCVSISRMRRTSLAPWLFQISRLRGSAANAVNDTLPLPLRLNLNLPEDRSRGSGRGRLSHQPTNLQPPACGPVQIGRPIGAWLQGWIPTRWVTTSCYLLAELLLQ